MPVFTICYGIISITLALSLNRIPDEMLVRKNWLQKPKLMIDIPKLRSIVRISYFVFGVCLVLWGTFGAFTGNNTSDGVLILALSAMLALLCTEPKCYTDTGVGRYVGIWFTVFFLGLAVYYAVPQVLDFFSLNS